LENTCSVAVELDGRLSIFSAVFTGLFLLYDLLIHYVFIYLFIDT